MSEKIENALNESRILVLVAQVIIGFQYRSVFQPGFDRLATEAQYVRLVGLGLMLSALVLLLAPAAFHQIVEEGRQTGRFLQFITNATMPALLPFAAGLGTDFYVVGDKYWGRGAAIACSISAAAIALFFWYGLEFLTLQIATSSHGKHTPPPEEPTPLKEKIRTVMMEARVVLPGSQALLGFQFAAVLTDGFEKLSTVDKSVHFASLVAISLSVILLMAPAAFHRIVEYGQDTERLHRFSSAMVLAAMAFLALGIAGDVVVVVDKVTHSIMLGGILGGATLLIYYSAWFVYMLYRRGTSSLNVDKPVQSSPS